jgi:peptide chain release factor 1
LDIRWDTLQARRDELSAKIIAGNIDSQEREKIQKELAGLAELLDCQAKVVELEQQAVQVEHEFGVANDLELKQLFEEELSTLNVQLKQAKLQLEELLFPPDEIDRRPVYIEIRAGAGGQEASLFAADLLRMYSNYAMKKGWSVEIVNASQTDLKGFREVVIYIKGKDAYGSFKLESGVHRVQRVPLTEGAGRVHTSTVTVAVLPEVKDDGEIEIDPNDLRIDFFRAGGAGGQHVNVTDSAVRITHLPTGTVVSCQDERSQHKNKAKGMKVLKSRILAEQTRQKELEMSEKRRELVGAGMRAEKVRTYNYPQNRISDHQIGLTLNKLDIMMEGDIDELIDALKTYDLELRRMDAVFKFSKK